MKYLKQSQRLTLNKRTVSQLNSIEMKTLRGGILTMPTDDCIVVTITTLTGKTVPLPWLPDKTDLITMKLCI